VFFQLRLRLSLQNTAELLNPDSLTQTGTKTGGGGHNCYSMFYALGNSLRKDPVTAVHISRRDYQNDKMEDQYDVLYQRVVDGERPE